MYKNIVAGFILGILLQACTTLPSDFEEAKRTDTIAAYKQFLTAHPQSEHREWVEQRITQLEEKKGPKNEGNLDKKMEDNEIRIGKLREYKKQIGVFTDLDFLDKEGWALAKSDGRIGIVGVVKNDTSSEFSLGMLQGTGSNPSGDARTAQWIKDGEAAANAAVMQGLKENREYFYLPPQEDYKMLCSLTFDQVDGKKARVLSGWLCNEDEI